MFKQTDMPDSQVDLDLSSKKTSQDKKGDVSIEMVGANGFAMPIVRTKR